MGAFPTKTRGSRANRPAGLFGGTSCSDTLRRDSRPVPRRRMFVPLDPKGHQGWYGEPYVHAIAAAAGLVAGKPIPDHDGIDWNIAHPGPRGTKRSPKLDLQVKTCSSPETDSQGESWKYRLSVAHYNQLAGPGFDVPRFLAFVITPKNPADYISIGPDAMNLSHVAYWTSFATEALAPQDEDSPKSVGIHVPKKNVLTPKSLLSLIDGDLEGAAE